MVGSKLKTNKVSERKEALLKCYSDVVHYLSVFNIDESMLEDAIQETFVEAFTNIHKLNDDAKIKYWLIKIAKRVGGRYAAKSKNLGIKECSYDEYVLQSRYGVENFCDKDFEKAIFAVENEQLYKYMNLLKDNERNTLLLQYVYGHKINEIADILGETPTNVKTLSRRAKFKLKKMIEKGGGL